MLAMQNTPKPSLIRTFFHRTACFAAGLFMIGPAAVSQTNAVPDPASLPDEPLSYNRDVRTILSNNCFACHGPDAGARKADLRLDAAEYATQERDGVRAIAPGSLEKSELVQRLFHPDPDKRMPPPDSTRQPTDAERKTLAAWVMHGAEYEPHWAYVDPIRPEAPAVPDESWPRNGIDYFILANLDERGLQPSPETDRVTLIRRLSFDLIGLPPTPDEVDAFVNDTRPDAYERVVDRLLASPHFGERLAIHWLDLVRYADTVGYHGDQVRGASGYRDYVIDAFNRNMPFDRFTREQLAGDLVDDPTDEQLLASGYNRLNMVTREGGAQEGDYIVRYAADRVRTTASVWMGSSLACAECHDHKYDPFTMKDFYSFAAFFADIKEKGVQSDGGNEAPFPPFMPLPTVEQAAEGWMLETQLDAIAPDAEARETLQAEKQRLNDEIRTSVITVTEVPRMTRVLNRGNWQDESGEVVGPAVPEFLGVLETDNERPDRMDLADWLVAEDNPLTARVFVNRLWKLYFGVGISRVLDDVGSQGEWPKHPALLDYLAVDFMENGWDIKHAIKQMVMSAAYRQSSMAPPKLKELDPYNRLVARQSRIRLDAELIRDNALRVSGLLSTSIGGRSVMPYQPEGYYRELNFPEREYQEDAGENLYRRGVYTHWQRTFLHPSLLAFDAPTREECTAERPVSNSPQQALTLLNDPMFVEAARKFGERIVKEGGESKSGRIEYAFRLALSREPTAEEAIVLAGFAERQLETFEADPDAADAFINVGAAAPDASLDPIELAAWSNVGRAILNLHETIYRY
jgi:mono/diheme cytochrome c family protein